MKFKQICLAIGFLVVLGCLGSDGVSGGTNVGDIGTGQEGKAARIFLTRRLTMSQANYTELKKEGKATMEAAGYRFDDAAHAVYGPAQAMAGTFVTNGTQMVGFTDGQGNIKVKDLTGITQLKLKVNLLDAGMATIRPDQFGTLKNPKDIQVTLDLDAEKFLTQMDKIATSSNDPDQQIGCSFGPDCGGANSCCLDYDGVISASGKPQSIICKLIYFPGSTCAKWLANGVCAYQGRVGGDEGVCLINHKGRWCQQINDSDFSVMQDKTKIVVGETVQIQVHNNTRKNEITASMSPNIGQLENPNPAAGSQGTGQTVTIAHYDGSGNNFTWQQDRTIIYRAPASLPNGQDKATITVTVFGQTGAQTLTIEVCH